MKSLGIIPARFASQRFPGKPLVDIKGKSMIQRVYNQCELSALDEVIVATDDERILAHCNALSINCKMTGRHESGTDRCAEVAAQFESDLVINIQGDEPFIEPQQINQLIRAFESSKFEIATLIKTINNREDLNDPNKVKVVKDVFENALYFSRQCIPYNRNNAEHIHYFRHVGIYAFDSNILQELTMLEESQLEKSEKLEQLRWLENGYKILTRITSFESPNIDTPEDLENLLKSL